MDLTAKIKSPIQASRFEINWSAGKIRPPWASGRVLTYTLLFILYCDLVSRLRLFNSNLISATH